jgi:DNA-binding beta-propeller fold protein YncE
MKLLIIWVITICLTACDKMERSSFETASPSSGGATLRLIQTIPLRDVDGRIDHLSIDLKDQRLFIAALGNNTVEIVDLTQGKVIHSISGLSEPQGIVFVPEFNKIFVAQGGDGACKIFDSNTFQLVDRLDLSSDADNVRYDDYSRTIFVGHGNGELSLIDASTDEFLGNIQLDGHPESFQLESSGSRIFVNIPSADQIAEVDRLQKKLVAKWTVSGASANYPMALDESQHRLFVGFRSPANLNVYDTETGKLVTTLESVGDMDDIFYDTAHKMVFVIGGEGYIDIFSQRDASNYELMMRIPTAPGTRTGLWVPELNRLYAAVPHRGTQEAEIKVYELQP